MEKYIVKKYIFSKILQIDMLKVWFSQEELCNSPKGAEALNFVVGAFAILPQFVG